MYEEAVNIQTFTLSFLCVSGQFTVKSLHIWCQSFIPTRKFRQLDAFGFQNKTANRWWEKSLQSKSGPGGYTAFIYRICHTAQMHLVQQSVQIEMLKLVTEKKAHVTSLRGITCEACEYIRTPVLVWRLKFVKCPTPCFSPSWVGTLSEQELLLTAVSKKSNLIQGTKFQLLKPFKRQELHNTRRF